MSDVLRQLPHFALLAPAVILGLSGAAVLVSELAWAVKHRDWPRPLATVIGLALLGLGGGLGWLLQGRA